MVTIEFGMCRSGCEGRSSGSIIAWNGVEEQGNRRLLGDQESISGDAQRGVMMEAAPSAPLVVAETDFLLELLPVGRKSSQ
jgi:hypothetical protein